MRFALFYHSLISDWNHGNAHFLRGVVAELLDRGHAVEVYEPEDSWSVQNLVARRGPKAVDEFHRAFPSLRSRRYRARDLDLDRLDTGVQGHRAPPVHLGRAEVGAERVEEGVHLDRGGRPVLAQVEPFVQPREHAQAPRRVLQRGACGGVAHPPALGRSGCRRSPGGCS